jgi:hypothetical protein
MMTHESQTILKKPQFEEALNTTNPKEGLQRLIDPALGEDYPMDSILKVRANPQTEQYNAAAELRLPSLLCFAKREANAWFALRS